MHSQQLTAPFKQGRRKEERSTGCEGSDITWHAGVRFVFYLDRRDAPLHGFPALRGLTRLPTTLNHNISELLPHRWTLATASV